MPSRIRISTGLQEGQLADLVKLDASCTAMYHEAGFDAAEVPARDQSDIVKLSRHNSVRVAEADNFVAGFLAWHDESPGVAYLVDLQVHPEYQRFGIAADLLDSLRDEARTLGLEQVVVRAWEKATWAMASLLGGSSASCPSTRPRRPRSRAGKRTASRRASR